MRPIPLAQLQGGGGGGGGSLMMILFVCCISSIISAIVGYVFRKQITGALGGAPAAAPAEAPVAAAMGRAPVNAARGRAPAAAARGRAPVKARRLKIKRRRKGGRKFRMKFGKKFGKKIGRRKGVRKIRGKLGRALKKFGRRKAVKKFGRRRGVKKIGRTFKKLRRRWCFAPETLVKLQDGNEVAMKDLKLGDILINGSIVNGVMNILNENNPYYKIHSSELDHDILVTGSHYIKDGDVYKQVKNFSGAEVTTKIDREVSCLITSDHNIQIGEFVFWDWEDDKIS